MRAAAAKQKRISLLINLLNFPLPHFALAEDRDLSTCLYLLVYPGRGYNDCHGINSMSCVCHMQIRFTMRSILHMRVSQGYVKFGMPLISVHCRRLAWLG